MGRIRKKDQPKHFQQPSSKWMKNLVNKGSNSQLEKQQNIDISQVIKNYTVIQHRRLGNYTLNSLGKRFALDQKSLKTILRTPKKVEQEASKFIENQDLQRVNYKIIQECLVRWFEQQLFQSEPIWEKDVYTVLRSMIIALMKCDTKLDESKINELMVIIVGDLKRSSGRTMRRGGILNLLRVNVGARFVLIVEPRLKDEKQNEISAIEHCASKLSKLFSKYGPSNIYNADEIGFFEYNRLGNSKNNENEKFIPENKRKKFRYMSALLACNMDGTHKTEPLIAHLDTAEEHLKMTPEDYKILEEAQGIKCVPTKHGCFHKVLFTEWLVTKFDAQMRKENRKVLLMLDNADVHPYSVAELTNTTLCFLPPGLTDYLQPLDAGIFHTLKMRYRDGMRSLPSEKQAGCGIIRTFDSIILLGKCWNSVESEIVQKGFSDSGYLVCMADKDYFEFDHEKNSIEKYDSDEDLFKEAKDDKLTRET